ncbi:putative OmpA family protein [Algoriphagus machipongonensis]|uniref:Putative OmpA family protein n=2 Tax=Algoriphagus machipongonensis TaxID=388413 RepID=A3HY97_9BACT|nr:putative OmpA family protein [Algoriphagus machipongonensis]EAZ81573.1 putative OmpA family protein [Algoriphagus machipongonensis]
MVLIMKKTLTILSIAAAMTLVTVGTTEAQKSKIRYADEQMELMNYQHAVEVYQEAYAKKPTYEAAKKTAQAYEVLRDYDNSYDWWKTTVSEYDEATPGDYMQLLRYGQLTDQLSEAKSILESKGVSGDSIQVEELLNVQSRRKLKVEGVEGLNSSGSDFEMAVDGSGNRYFVSDRGGTYPSKMPSLRIDGRNKIFSEEKQDYTDREYFSVYKQDTEGNVSEVVSNIPDTYNFSDPSFAKESGMLFYSVTRGITKVKKTRDIVVQPEIYYSKVNEDGTLTGFTAVPFNDSIGYAVMNPYVDEAAKRLYFTSDMPGGMGGTDLYYSEYDENMTFGTPVNLGSPVNTPGNESHAFRKEDKFYFSSTGHKGMGGMDIFMADYSATGMSNVMNMGSPVNSLADDFAYREVEREGKEEVYLSSNRKGGMGLDDIYSVAEVYKQFLARVIDCEGLVIGDSYLATLRDKTHNGDVQTSRNSKGELTAELEPDSDFGIKISKPGYFSITDEDISTKGFEGDTLKREYKLIPIPYQLPVYVDIVYYDLDKYQIREDAKPVLDKLGELMNRYEFLDLLVGSHTDSRASDEYNITLSNNRAEAVTEYMAQYNIPAERIRLEWFGEQQLVNDCGDGVPCPETDHQLNRRSELVLEAFSDPSKQYEIPEELKDKDFCDPEDLFTQIQDEIAQIPTIYFDFDKSMLRSVHKKELERTAIMLKRMPNLMLYIEGHTDQRGDDAYNQSLSERRADAVKAYLTKRGIEGERMEETWFGETKPVNDCSELDCTSAMHQLNRRTELRVGKSQFTYSGRQKKVDVM